MLLSAVNASSIVGGICLNSSAIFGASLCSASKTTAVVSLPSVPSSLSCPIVTPKPFAIALANLGVCSNTLRNSSPRNAPEAKP